MTSTGERAGALREEIATALARVEGEAGARMLWRALRELPLDGATALVLADRLQELQPES